MINRWQIALILIVLAMTGCSSHSDLDPSDNSGTDINRITVEALYYSTTDGVEADRTGSTAVVTFPSLPDGGIFVKLMAPDGVYFDTEPQWDPAEAITDDVLALVLVDGSAVEVGIVPLAEDPQTPVTLTLPLLDDEPAAPNVSTAAIAGGISLVDAGNGAVELSWVEACAGDFNFDGTVDARDILPVAECLGLTYDTTVADVADNPLYWLDADGDGLIASQDLSFVEKNYQSRVTGFVVRQNEAVVPGESTSDITVLHEDCTPREGLPATYSLVVEGSITDNWAIAAVDDTGDAGTWHSITLAPADLQVTIQVTGLELFEIEDLVPGSSEPLKIGSRIIDPIEIIGAPNVANAEMIGENIFVFSNVPYEQQLLLDVQYLPVVDLATGTSIDLTTISDVLNSLVSSAVPFELISGTEGTTEMNVEINLLAYDEGGYTVDTYSEISYPDGTSSTLHSMLDYAEGVVRLDLDLDGDFNEEWVAADADSDGVSDAWLDETQLIEEFPEVYPADVIASVTGVDQTAGYLEISDIESFVPEEELLFDTEPVRVWVHEFTAIDPEIDPWNPDPATRYLMNLQIYRNPETSESYCFAEFIQVYHQAYEDPGPYDPLYTWPLEGTVVSAAEDAITVNTVGADVTISCDATTSWLSDDGVIEPSALSTGDYVHVELYLIGEDWIAREVYRYDESGQAWTDPGGLWMLEGTVTAISAETFSIQYAGVAFTINHDEGTLVMLEEDDGTVADLNIGDYVLCDAEYTADGMQALMVMVLPEM